MSRELYNWDQVRAYIIIALYNVEKNNKFKTIENIVKELDSLQTMYGKEGVIGLANRLLNKNK